MGSGFRTFQSGEVLTSSNVQNFLMDQSVMVFAGTAARSSAITSPEEGMITYDTSTDLLEVYNGSKYKAFASMGTATTSGSILQVVSTSKVDTFTTTSQTFADITGLTATITPTSSSSKVLIIAQLAVSTGFAVAYGFFKLAGGNTANYVGTAAGNRISAVFGGYSTADQSAVVQGLTIVYLDSPATTSSTTYSVQTRGGLSVPSVAVNRSHPDNNDANAVRGASSITVMEVSA